jgi:antitoxin component YwqK of YwqJK toxin-antitoxin module
MKKQLGLFCFLSLFAASIAFAQNELNKTDAQGLKQGKWEKHHKNGVKRYSGNFKDDKPIGTFVYYDELGKKSNELTYTTGDTAQAVFFHENAKIKAKGIYVNTKKEGLWKYFDYDQVLSAQENYIHGVRHGESVVYYINGGIAKKYNYIDGLVQGNVNEYFESGTLKFEGNFVDGNPDGLVKYYHPNGKLKTEGVYQFAVMQGKWMHYEESGKMIVQEFYDKGKFIKAIDFRESNEPKEYVPPTAVKIEIPDMDSEPEKDVVKD